MKIIKRDEINDIMIQTVKDVHEGEVFYRTEIYEIKEIIVTMEKDMRPKNHNCFIAYAKKRKQKSNIEGYRNGN